MKKIILLIVIVALVWVQQVNAQVSINTTTSSDSTAKNATGAATTTEGFLIPGVDRQKAQDIINVPVSSRFCVNSFTT
ncbi:hypothetical protein [Chryseobacterium herbae]|uniref:Uncharacterized protein n=1 Tax=Chryseobacterium herbae TaxID=2976476 RepID=A0ABT2IPG0_9FLAO|nr:hypothetical protein [Chryseobacterium sp. pc1-10]MCT2560411.1 hypothetical protein [Chryseobacterium sp. pc1-10]